MSVFTPQNLRTEYAANPLGLGFNRPRLSWQFPPADDLHQVAYELRGASTSGALTTEPDLFRTGRMEGNESVFVAWPGPTLASRQRAYWQVRVWIAGQAEASPWSEVASLECGLLKQGDWSAEWISYGEPADDSTPPVYFRKTFSLATKPVSARIHASALGIFDLKLNEQNVHPKQHFLPGWSDYNHRVQAVTFDVTHLLQEGENCLGAILGDGWYSGYLGYTYDRQVWGKTPALLVQLELSWPNGETQRIGTDGTWKASQDGPIRKSDFYNGEDFDARCDYARWAASGMCESGWGSAVVREVPKETLLDPKIVDPVFEVEEMPALSRTEPLPGVHIYDFGQNLVGWVRARLRGPAGTTVTLRFGEMLNPDGTLYVANLRKAKATDTYTFGANEDVEWEPLFTFHGFRYAEISGVSSPSDCGEVIAVVLHNTLKAGGSFSCSHPLVNQLEKNIRWGLRGNFLEVPTDCPQRDERLGWTGDIQVFAKTACFLYDVDAFLLKWMRDLRDGQREDGAFPDIAPTFIGGFGNAAWADAGVIVPWVVYRRYGDTRILEENYDAMKAWISYQDNTARAGVRPPTTYGDWLAIDAVIPQHAPVPSDLIGTAYFARTTAIMARVAELLDEEDDASHFRELRGRVETAFQREYVTAAGRIVGDCQTAYLLALAFDLLPEQQRQIAVDRLVTLIKDRDWHLSTGFVGTPLLGPVLSRFGRHDVAMRLLLQETFPSWLFPVTNGATTMWERWNSYTPEQGFGEVSMNSFNHYAYGAVGEWMVHAVAGIAPGHEAPGYRHILFQPQLCEGLDHASADVETPYGRARISWRKEGTGLVGELIVPPNTFADFRSTGLVSLQRTDGQSVVDDRRTRLSSGTYSFQWQPGGVAE